MKVCVLYDGERSGSFNINTGVNQGCVIAPTLFSILFLAAFISLAAVDQAKGVDIIYRTDGELFNVRRLKAKTKVKATSIVDLPLTATAPLPLPLPLCGLWPGSIRREWPGSGAVRALDKK